LGVKANSQRIFIIVIVAVFFLTSLTTFFYLIYDMTQNSDSNQVATQTKQEENKLEGTKLANFTPVEKVDQLQKIDIVEGTGAEVGQNATVTAHYTGALAKDGTIFQSSKDTGEPFTAELSGLIPGWQQGIPGMKVGGVRRLVIPAEQAYGAQATGNIPANSDLVFDIEMIEVK
jgi:FKBP-type peptidyl-prolyl cis-trans isomerase